MNGLKQRGAGVCGWAALARAGERGGLSVSASILVGAAVLQPPLRLSKDRELSGRSVAVRRDLDVASMSGPSWIG